MLLQKRGAAAVLPLLFVLVSCSCEFLPSNGSRTDTGSGEGDVSQVKATVVWRMETDAESNQSMLIKDGIIHFAEKFSEGAIAVRASDGKVIWKDTGRFEFCSNPLFFANGKIGYFAYNDYEEGFGLYNGDGSNFMPVIFADDGYEINRYNAWVEENTVYYSSRKYGLAAFNIEEDIYIQDGKYMAEPELLYPRPPDSDNDGIIQFVVPRIVNGVLYSGVSVTYDDPGTYFAIDLTTNKVTWETTGEYLDAWSDWWPEYKDGRLITYDAYGFGILDAATGDILVEKGSLYGGGMYSGGYIYDDKLYVTNGSHPNVPDGMDNIQCLSLETGEHVWTQMFPGSHGSNPICYSGITYIASQGELRILNARTGEYLAYDSSVEGDMWQLTNVLKYNDTMIIRNTEELVCVKMDFRLDKEGNLYQAE